MNSSKIKYGSLRFVFVFLFSLVMGGLTLALIRVLPMFNDNSAKTKPSFLMNYYFTRLSDKMLTRNYPNENSIVLLDAANLRRDELAKLIEHLDSLHPKVIGLDLLHLEKEYTESDSLLVQAINKCNSNLVLPIFVDNGETFAPFYKDQVDDSLFGSVIFDEPWNNKVIHGEYYTFVYQIAKAFCGKELDTASFLVDYEPMDISNRIRCDTPSQICFIDPNQCGRPDDIEGKIVLVGALDRSLDAITLDFPVHFQDTTKPNECVPGMVALSYQIRSFLHKEHQLKKANDSVNRIVCILGLAAYVIVCILLSKLDEYFENSRNKVKRMFWFGFPLIQLFTLVGAEYLLVESFCLLVRYCRIVPNLWLVMASLPYVNCLDFIFLNRMTKDIHIIHKIHNNETT